MPRKTSDQTRLRVLAVIASYAEKYHEARPTLDTIVDESGRKKRTVIYAVQELEAEGSLRIIRQHRRPNVYEITELGCNYLHPTLAPQTIYKASKEEEKALVMNSESSRTVWGASSLHSEPDSIGHRLSLFLADSLIRHQRMNAAFRSDADSDEWVEAMEALFMTYHPAHAPITWLEEAIDLAVADSELVPWHLSSAHYPRPRVLREHFGKVVDVCPPPTLSAPEKTFAPVPPESRFMEPLRQLAKNVAA